MKLYELYNRPQHKKSLNEGKLIAESIKLCKAVTSLLENDGFDFEPDPAYAGVKGINRDTGAGNQAAKAAGRKQAQDKLNATWRKMLGNAKRGGAEGQQKMMPYLQKLVKVATQKGFKLDPDPTTIMGLSGLE